MHAVCKYVCIYLILIGFHVKLLIYYNVCLKSIFIDRMYHYWPATLHKYK